MLLVIIALTIAAILWFIGAPKKHFGGGINILAICLLIGAAAVLLYYNKVRGPSSTTGIFALKYDYLVLGTLVLGGAAIGVAINNRAMKRKGGHGHH